MRPARYVWLDGRYVPASRASVPVTTHAIHYGTTAFEGVRAYWNGSNLNLFRLGDHMARLGRSAASYGMRPRLTGAEMGRAAAGSAGPGRQARSPGHGRPGDGVAGSNA